MTINLELERVYTMSDQYGTRIGRLTCAADPTSFRGERGVGQGRFALEMAHQGYTRYTFNQFQTPDKTSMSFSIWSKDGVSFSTEGSQTLEIRPSQESELEGLQEAWHSPEIVASIAEIARAGSVYRRLVH